MNWDGLTNSLTGRKDLKKKKFIKKGIKKKTSVPSAMKTKISWFCLKLV